MSQMLANHKKTDYTTDAAIPVNLCQRLNQLFMRVHSFAMGRPKL